MNCNRLIKCQDDISRRCIRQLAHLGGCNPFQPTPPTIGNEREKQDRFEDRIEIVYHRALEDEMLVTQ
jgi:hypothetical protein